MMSNDDTVSSTEVQEIILENRNDLKNFLNRSKKYIIIDKYVIF